MSRNLADISRLLQHKERFDEAKLDTFASGSCKIYCKAFSCRPIRRISCFTHLKAHSSCDYVSIFCLHGDFTLHQYYHLIFHVCNLQLNKLASKYVAS